MTIIDMLEARLTRQLNTWDNNHERATPGYRRLMVRSISNTHDRLRRLGIDHSMTIRAGMMPGKKLPLPDARWLDWLDDI